MSLSGDAGVPEEVLPLFHQASRLVRDCCRLACMTRSGPNSWSSLEGFGNGFMRARMWTQYAGNHSGLCLAFDQARLIEAAKACERMDVKLYKAPVRYRTEEERELPLSFPIEQVRDRPDQFAAEAFPSFVAALYFSKSWDWSTESEYRFLVHGQVAEYEYIDVSAALTGVFCGSRMPESRLQELRFLCPDLWSTGRIFRVTWINGLPYARSVTHSVIDPATSKWKVPPAPGIAI